MKRTLLLSLSLFALANTFSVQSAQAVNWKQTAKHTWTGIKIAGGVTCAGISTGTAFLTWLALTHKNHSISPNGVNDVINGLDPRICAVFALTSGLVSGIALKSAYNDIK